ncbi:hypothetical protein Tco_1439542 [Tanacetum coccineum]
MVMKESKELSSLALDEPHQQSKSERERVTVNVLDAGDPNLFIGDCPITILVNKDQKAFIGRFLRAISENDVEDKTIDETCLMAQSSKEVTLNFSCYSDNASSLDNDNM